MEADNFNLQIARRFSAEVLNFVYADHNVPLLAYEHGTLYGNVGTFVISLIKGELRNNFGRGARQALLRAEANNKIEDIFMRFPESYLKNPCNNMTILKAIAFITMYSIFYHLHDVELTQIYAHNAVSEMLITLEDSNFVQRGGLAQLENYTKRLLDEQPEFRRAFEEGTYPW